MFKVKILRPNGEPSKTAVVKVTLRLSYPVDDGLHIAPLPPGTYTIEADAYGPAAENHAQKRVTICEGETVDLVLE